MRILFFFLAAIIIGKTSLAQDSTAHWKDRKFSMFIHFGAYSTLGGVYKGKPVTYGLSEQIQAHAGIYSDVYENIAKEFNPVEWNADSIADLAVAAGMRSIVITSKHHDGFAIFNSAYTKFDIVDATAFKRDLIAELAEACKKRGLKFGLYFSLIDWHYPQAYPISSHNSDLITDQHHQYNLHQISELLSNYGEISELWFDMGSMTMAQSIEMRQLVKRLQPGCMVGSRIGNDQGDFTVMSDNQEPNYIIGVPWQSPASFFDETWGYRSWQKRVPVEEKYREKLASLIRVVSRGGNYLLNIGPKGDGSLVDYEAEVLKKIGLWLKKNGEAIYSADPDPFFIKFDWGSITRKQNRIFLHLMTAPRNNSIFLPGLTANPLDARILSSGRSCHFKKTSTGLEIHIPAEVNLNADFEVLEVKFQREPEFPHPNSLNYSGEGLALNSSNSFKFYSNSGIDYNTRFRSTIKEAWTINPAANIEKNAFLYFTDQELGQSVVMQLGQQRRTIALTGGDRLMPAVNSVPDHRLGELYISGPYPSSIEGLHGDIHAVDTNSTWSNRYPRTWRKSQAVSELPAGLQTAWYAYQEIHAKEEGRLMANILSGEGLVLYLNGEERFLDYNLSKDSINKQQILLNLKKGRNQVLIKLFSNFNEKISFSLDYLPAANQYRMDLGKIHLRKNQLLPVSWKLADPPTVHQHIHLPNLELRFE